MMHARMRTGIYCTSYAQAYSCTPSTCSSTDRASIPCTEQQPTNPNSATYTPLRLHPPQLPSKNRSLATASPRGPAHDHTSLHVSNGKPAPTAHLGSPGLCGYSPVGLADTVVPAAREGVGEKDREGGETCTCCQTHTRPSSCNTSILARQGVEGNQRSAPPSSPGRSRQTGRRAGAKREWLACA